jgi:hypothetical protein
VAFAGRVLDSIWIGRWMSISLSRRSLLEFRTICITDAHRRDGQRFVVRADEKLTAFVELESATRSLMTLGAVLPCFAIIALTACNGGSQTRKPGAPEKHLPPNITQLVAFGERLLQTVFLGVLAAVNVNIRWWPRKNATMLPLAIDCDEPPAETPEWFPKSNIQRRRV